MREAIVHAEFNQYLVLSPSRAVSSLWQILFHIIKLQKNKQGIINAHKNDTSIMNMS